MADIGLYTVDEGLNIWKPTETSGLCSITCRELTNVPAKSKVKVTLGVRWKTTPSKYLAQPCVRENLSFYIRTVGGPIDQDFEGEWSVIIENISDTTFAMQKGARYVQWYLIPVVNQPEVNVWTERRKGQFPGTKGTFAGTLAQEGAGTSTESEYNEPDTTEDVDMDYLPEVGGPADSTTNHYSNHDVDESDGSFGSYDSEAYVREPDEYFADSTTEEEAIDVTTDNRLAEPVSLGAGIVESIKQLVEAFDMLTEEVTTGVEQHPVEDMDEEGMYYKNSYHVAVKAMKRRLDRVHNELNDEPPEKITVYDYAPVAMENVPE